MEQSPTSTPARSRPEDLPLVDDRYRVLRKIGEGGMGAVFEGENRILRRPVAIKALRPHLSLDPEAMARFQREAELTSSLNHPHIVAVLDMDFRRAPYLVMELLEGESLRARLVREGRVAQSRCLVVATQILSALAESHERGILHRDVKPSNVFLVTNAGVGVSAKLLDFGIALLTDSKPGQNRITQPSRVVGSGAYMSPEQVLAEPLGPETDIFSVGVVLYEALSGKKPFLGTDAVTTMARIVAGDPPSRIEGVNPRLMTIVLRALSRKPAERFACAREMSSALEPLLPRFSALNLGNPLAVNESTELSAYTAAWTGCTGPSSLIDTLVDEPRSRRTSHTTRMRGVASDTPAPAPPIQAAVPLAVTLPIAVRPWVESCSAPARPVLAPAQHERVVVPTRTSRTHTFARVGALLLLGVGGVAYYGGPQRTATLGPQARPARMEWRNARATTAVLRSDTPNGPASGLSSSGASPGAVPAHRGGGRPTTPPDAFDAFDAGRAEAATRGPGARSMVLNGNGPGDGSPPAADLVVAAAPVHPSSVPTPPSVPPSRTTVAPAKPKPADPDARHLDSYANELKDIGY